MDMDFYTPEMFLEFRREQIKKQQDPVSPMYTPLRSPPPGTPTSIGTSKPIANAFDKALDTWNKARRDKSSFAILREDKHYHTWKEKYIAELLYQELTMVIDPQVDLKALFDPSKRALFLKQQSYLWTVLLQVFQNPLGTLCITDHISNHDARGA